MPANSPASAPAPACLTLPTVRRQPQSPPGLPTRCSAASLLLPSPLRPTLYIAGLQPRRRPSSAAAMDAQAHADG